MSPAAQSALDEIKATLDQRPRAADLWDAMSHDERAVRLARCEQRTRRNVFPHMAYDRQPGPYAQANIRRALQPIIAESEAICAAGEVVAL